MKKFLVTEMAPMQSTRTFKVRHVSWPEWQSVEVWYGGTPRCCHCVGQLVAMSSSCEHSNAVRRHVKGEKK